MAKRGPQRGGGRPAPRGRQGSGRPSASSSRTPSGNRRTRPGAVPEPPDTSAPLPRTLRLGVVPGATPGKWVERWRERMPGVALELVPLLPSAARDALGETADLAILRLPIDDEGLHVIRLYEELPVVVMPREDELTVLDEIAPGDLDGRVVLVPGDAPGPGVDIPGAVAPAAGDPERTEDAIELAAAGIGVAIVPMSLARLHHRKDLVHRPLVGGAPAPVALAWPVDRGGPAIDAFIGIVRGRTPNSSR